MVADQADCSLASKLESESLIRPLERYVRCKIKRVCARRRPPFGVTNRLRQQVISERWRRQLAGACLVWVSVYACLQFPEIFLAPEDKPLPEAQVITATICLMEIKRLSMMRHRF